LFHLNDTLKLVIVIVYPTTRNSSLNHLQVCVQSDKMGCNIFFGQELENPYVLVTLKMIQRWTETCWATCKSYQNKCVLYTDKLPRDWWAALRKHECGWNRQEL